jgi:DNA topoisomerase-3
MVKLLNEVRTDLLSNFVSRRNGRKFKAFLVAQPQGKVGFEFAPRAPKAEKKDAPRKSAKPLKARRGKSGGG